MKMDGPLHLTFQFGAIGLFLTLTTAATYYGSSGQNCRCTTSSPCFPGVMELAAFNASVGGRLLQPRPTAYPCYPASFNATACAAISLNRTDGFYRSSFIGSMQSWNMEDIGNERCPIENANVSGAVCYQGRVPLYGVQAESVDDIQKTVRFATAHNLRVSIKNTGHDYLARSANVGSVTIWTHRLRSVTVNMTYVPTGCGSDVAPRPAVILAAGEQWRPVYQQVSTITNDTYIVVGGDCHSVGAAGGYSQNGGHGPMSPLFGLAIDNALQYEIVLADGTFHVVNQCQDPDLFWALRGGGGGTFGVVTKVVYKLNPSPMAFTALSITASPLPQGTLLSRNLTTEIFLLYARQASVIDDARWGGSISINQVEGYVGEFIIPQNFSSANASTQPFVDAFKNLSQNGTVLKVDFNTTSPRSFFQWRSNLQFPTVDIDNTGYRGIVGSRLIPQSAFQDPQGVAEAFTKAGSYADSFISIHGAGKGVREQNGSATSCTPAWRQAYVHAQLFSTFKYDSSNADIDKVESDMEAGVDVLRQAYPDSGGYIGESFLEPNWKATFWGMDNYNRLLQIKKRVDPNGLFTCVQCVGSDEWDFDGNCKASY